MPDDKKQKQEVQEQITPQEVEGAQAAAVDTSKPIDYPEHDHEWNPPEIVLSPRLFDVEASGEDPTKYVGDPHTEEDLGKADFLESMKELEPIKQLLSKKL